MGIKYPVNENFFETWSPEMSYVLGFIYADGSLEKSPYIRARYLRISSTDLTHLEQIKETLQSSHNLAKRAPASKKGKTNYLLRIGSHKIYHDLNKLGLYPNKSLTIDFPNLPRKYASDFIRGYFDGDGCIHIEYYSTKKDDERKAKRLRTIFTGGSKKFIYQLNSFLHSEINLTLRNVYKQSRAYRLIYSTSDSIKLFKFMYNSKTSLRLERKFATFNRYLRDRKK